jgi:hypothetical protein
LPWAGSAKAETVLLPAIPTVLAQLTIAPSPAQPSATPAQLPPAPAPRPAAQRPPAARPARPPASPARPSAPAAPVAAPAPAPATPASDQAAKELLKQIGDLRSEVAYLNVQTGNLTTQVSSLSGIVNDLRKQLADAEQHLKDEMGRAARTPAQPTGSSGAVATSADAPFARFLQSSWSDIAVPTTLFLLLCSLLGTMIVGVPVRALMYRVPRRQAVATNIPPTSISIREGVVSRIDPR